MEIGIWLGQNFEGWASQPNLNTSIKNSFQQISCDEIYFLWIVWDSQAHTPNILSRRIKSLQLGNSNWNISISKCWQLEAIFKQSGLYYNLNGYSYKCIRSILLGNVQEWKNTNTPLFICALAYYANNCVIISLWSFKYLTSHDLEWIRRGPFHMQGVECSKLNTIRKRVGFNKQ